MRKLVIQLSILAYLGCGAAYAKQRLYPACGAIAHDGRFAAALPDAHDLDLELSGTDGSIEKAQLELAGQPESCRLAFNREGNYLAVGVRIGTRDKTWLHVGVFDDRSRKWISSFEVGPAEGMPFPMRLEGFLGGSSTLVVTGFGRGSYERPDRSAILVALLSPDGHLTCPVITREILGSYFNWEVNFVDAAHNRVWFNHSPQFCPLSSATLTGPLESGPSVDENVLGSLACDLPAALGFPSSDELVGASTRSDQSWVWRIDLAKGTGDKLVLPAPPRSTLTRWNQVQITHNVPVSPDGRVFAIGRAWIAWNVADQPHYKPGEIYVIQVKPLKVLGTFEGKDNCGPAVAVDHRNGRAMILSHQCGGGWKLLPVRLPGSM
jgi:hypothetical protein